jgi:hypothetical protein
MLGDEDRFRANAGDATEVPPARSLTEIIASCGVAHVDVCKMDIEGSEFGVFDSELSWLDRVDRLVMEVHSAFGDPEAIATACESGGFKVLRSTTDQQPVTRLHGDGLLYARRC